MPIHRSFLCLNAVALCLFTGALQAADLRITTMADDHDGFCDAHCSLRDAVSAANREPGPDLIRLPAGNFVLSRLTDFGEPEIRYDEDANLNGDLDVVDHLTIRGAGRELTRIRGIDPTQPPYRNDRLLEVLSGATLHLQHLALEDGRTAFNGAAAENHGHLRLQQVRVQGNRAATINPTYREMPGEEGFRYGQGGGIANYGTLEVYSSDFVDNHSRGDDVNNIGRGGAIFNRGSLLLRDSNIRDNSASDEAERSAGSGIYNNGVADISRSAFVGNSGSEGGRGFAIANDGQLKLTNSTLSDHIGTGGALSNGYHANPPSINASATLINVTIANNNGYGVQNTGELLIRNSLIAGNLGFFGDEVTNCRNNGPRYRYQAIGLVMNSEPSNCSADLYLPFEQTFTRLIYPLADNNSTVPSHALRKGSLAVDSGVGSCTAHDQRRLTRPRDGDGDGVARCDLGAYERAKP
ncbi:choice-of-anchor Q domain-containing protein [Pseudomonas borbori]